MVRQPGTEEAEIIDRLVRLANAVPEGVELGYHLCYGDFNHKHIVEPEDMELMVRISNKLSRQIGRPMDWIHMPVPRERFDDAFFAALKNLHLRPETRLISALCTTPTELRAPATYRSGEKGDFRFRHRDRMWAGSATPRDVAATVTRTC